MTEFEPEGRAVPLDLRAVEARNAPEVCEHGSDARTLLAHCRALRAALDGLLKAVKNGPYIDGWPVSEWLEPIEVTEQATAVLAQATDQEGT